MLNFVEALYEYTKDATNEDGIVMREFKDISLDAYNKSGFKITYDAVIKKFAGSDAEIYYNEILKVRTSGLIVVSALDINNAERIVEDLKTNFVTRDIVNLVTTDKVEVHNQLQVEGFTIDALHLKAMIDRVVIDHEKKIIYPYDLKTTWNVEGFYEDYYLYRRSYIQAYVYDVAMNYYRNEFLPDYVVVPLKFIVCDSIGYYNPLIYSLTEEDLEEAWQGFEYKGRRYPGVWEIVDELEWSLENNLWNISKKSYENGGVIHLKS